MFRLFFGLMIVLGSFLSSPSSSFAQEELEIIKNSDINNPPIPVGTLVEFVHSTEGLAVKWFDQGQGKTRVAILSEVSLHLVKYHSFSPDEIRYPYIYVYPNIGDKGFVGNWVDAKSVQSSFVSDGIIDYVSFEEYLEPNAAEEEALELAGALYRELVLQSLFLFNYRGSCSTFDYRMNGEVVEKGPYGLTFKVPETGGTLEAVSDTPVGCGAFFPRGHILWGVEVHPGDFVDGTDTNQSIKDLKPYQFCSITQRMDPQWQATTVVSANLSVQCDIKSGDESVGR